MATVLIVDDRQVNRDLVRTVLGYHGHETLEAIGGAEALELLRVEHPDLVIADVVMPNMDGYELARAIRSDETTKAIPVLFYTANYVEAEVRPIATAVGVERIVTKSGDLTELINAIDDTLGTTPEPAKPMEDEQFDREHLRVLNAKLIEKIGELEESARLHQMVDAIVAVGDDLSLPTMLRRIATAAHSVVAASHTSLITVATEGRPAGCVHIGGDAEAAHRIEVLAADHCDELVSFGYLVVPIKIGSELFGNVLLLPGANGPFTSGDQTLLDTLARAAGVAVANSQLYDDARRRQAWLAASADVASTLLVSDPAKALQLVACGARRVIGAQIAWVEVAYDTTVSIDACDAIVRPSIANYRFPLDEAVLFADVCSTGQPVVLDDATSDNRLRELLPRTELGIGPLLGVPLVASGRSFGVLFIANERGGPPFSPLDVEMARAFASRSALTLQFARAEDDRQRLNLLEDRNRIARDLHDVVIQRLFGLGLRLERVRGQLPDTVSAHLAEISNDLDHTIDEIRNTIFSLRLSPEDRPSLRAEVLKIIEPTRFLLTFAPRLRIEGPIDHMVPDDVQPHLLATLSEALSNIVRHAAATRVDVLLRAQDGQLLLRVSDDGRGVPTYRTESGLANLRKRAADLGGTMVIAADADHRGTVLTWTVPIGGHSTGLDISHHSSALSS